MDTPFHQQRWLSQERRNGTGIVLTAGQTATLNIPLQVGNVTETVTVSGSAELIDTIITLFAPLVFCALNLTATCDLQRYVAGFLQR